ncbi:MAG: lipopolysaccharide transport periplasmic protein LptA [Pseudomonadota bacterium]
MQESRSILLGKQKNWRKKYLFLALTLFILSCYYEFAYANSIDIPKGFHVVLRRTRANERSDYEIHEHVSPDVQQHHNVKDEGDNYKTIHFEADTLLFNNETKIGIYQGHIKLTQGTRVLTADYATSYSNQEGEIVKIVAIGHPAIYHSLVFHKRPKLIATGNTIYYYPLKDYLEAVGDAQIIQGQNHFQGPHINYDFKKKTVGSPSSRKGHTQILLAPLQTLHL